MKRIIPKKDLKVVSEKHVMSVKNRHTLDSFRDIIIELYIRFFPDDIDIKGVLKYLEVAYNVRDISEEEFVSYWKEISSTKEVQERIVLLQRGLQYLTPKLAGCSDIFGRLIFAEDSVEYYELLLVKLEQKVLELELEAKQEKMNISCVQNGKLSVSKLDHNSYCKYIALMKQVKDKILELTLLLDVKKLKEDMLSQVSKIALEVFLSAIEKDKWQDVVLLYKERLKMIEFVGGGSS